MESVIRQTLPVSIWRLARLDRADSVPVESDWMPSNVPGAVQLDWARAHGLPDLNFGKNVSLYDGLEDFHWLYATEIPHFDPAPGIRLFLRGDGLDFEAEFRIGGKTVAEHTGISTPFELDLTETRPGERVEILIRPAPKRPGFPPDRSQASHVTKAAVSYGWDWHPRLIPLGLCHEVRFELRPEVHIRDVDFRYALSDGLDSAEIEVIAQASAPSEIRWTLADPDGRVVVESQSPRARLDAPRLWWTHDHGEQALYTLTVTLDAPGSSSCSRRVGFRRVRLVMPEIAWQHPDGFPKSRSHPPMTVELNGRRIFARGSNWVNPDIFHGRVGRQTYERLLELAKLANFNILRCWGGAPQAKEDFFEICDALGILVWQDFPLACNAYPDDTAYLADLDRESRAMIAKVRQHPCLALWCGGNELFNSWSRMGDQSLALRLLNRNCFDLDPNTPFLPTAPMDGMAHGDYRFRDPDGRDIFQIFQQSANTAYSEFGCPGLSPVPYLKAIIPADELWPPRAGTSWEVHHAFHAWSSDPGYWISLSTLEHYFGPARDLEELVARGEWLQGEGFRSVFEEARRQAPRCAMAMNWCFNEAWPSAANNSIINYPDLPKPSYHLVREACRPILASARIPKFQWLPGEIFSAEIWLLSDSPDSIEPGELVVSLSQGATTTELLRWNFPTLAPQQNLPGPTGRFILPDNGEGAFFLRLRVTGRSGWDSEYRLSMKGPAAARTAPFAPLLNM